MAKKSKEDNGEKEEILKRKEELEMELQRIEEEEKEQNFYKDAPKRIEEIEKAVEQNRKYLKKLYEMINTMSAMVDTLVLSK